LASKKMYMILFSSAYTVAELELRQSTPVLSTSDGDALWESGVMSLNNYPCRLTKCCVFIQWEKLLPQGR